MSESTAGATAAELRATFDASFARAIESEREGREELLAIRVRDARLALRVRETAGILRCPPMAAMPSRNPSLQGLAGVRGALVAVYGLASLVGDGLPPSHSGWIVLCAADKSVALLFDELVAYARVSAGDIHRGESPEIGGPKGEVVRIGGVHHAIIGIPELLDTIHRAAQSGGDKER